MSQSPQARKVETQPLSHSQRRGDAIGPVARTCLSGNYSIDAFGGA